jgi:methyltransferase-like protein
VPTAVQDKILDICKRNLAPGGIAYVSYNTYPGWHMRGMIRDMMRFHTKFATEPTYRTRQARNLLDFLANSTAGQNSPYSLLLRSEVESLRQSADSYLFHEHLEDVNDPIYFFEFAERAAAKGLRYLGEADLGVMLPSNLPPEVQSVLHILSSDLIHLEQYMDFLRNRMFRQTLLCHQQVQPSYSLRPERLLNLYVAAALSPTAEHPNLASTDPEEFQGRDGLAMKTAEPLLKTAMAYLGEIWPRAVRFSELLATTRELLQLSPNPDMERHEQDVQMLGQCVLGGYTSGGRLVELSTQPPRFTSTVSDRPVVSPLARLQARSGHHLTNLRHETVMVDDVGRRLAEQLDGSRDRQALRDLLVELVLSEQLDVEAEGQPVREPEKVREIAAQTVEQQLAELARHALLIG